MTDVVVSSAELCWLTCWNVC